MTEGKIKTAAVVLAAGQGKRMHAAVAKQFLLLNEKPLLYYSLKAFEESPVEAIVLVTGEGEVSYCQEEIINVYGFSKIVKVVPGGRERYHSVHRGLLALSEIMNRDGVVLIHDGARPLVTRDIIGRTLEAAREYGACVAAMPVKDTIKVADGNGFAAHTPDRSTLWQIQTPQAFYYGLVFDAYEKLLSDESCQKGITDDAMVVEALASKRVKLTEGSYENIKVTTPEDMKIAECFLRERTV